MVGYTPDFRGVTHLGFYAGDTGDLTDLLSIDGERAIRCGLGKFFSLFTGKV
jgi:hypothetical protein